MADKQASNQDIMDAINGIRRDFATKDDLKSMEGRLECKFATKGDFKRLEAMVSGIGNRLVVIADTMATSNDVNELKKYVDDSLDYSVSDVELRLGRRIDNFLKPSNKRKLRKFIAAKA